MPITSDRLVDILSYSWPGLVLAVMAIVLAVVHLGTHRKAATLVLIAGMLILLNALRYPIVEMFYAEEWRQRGTGEYIRLMRLNSIFGQVAYVGSGALLICAAFAGRKADGPAFPVNAAPPPRPPRI